MFYIFNVVFLIFLHRTEESHGAKDKEIFMYDLASKAVSKLNGDISKSFVEVAESNAKNQSIDSLTKFEEVNEAVDEDEEDRVAEGSELHEVRVPFENHEGDHDLDVGSSDRFEQFVDVSGMSIDRRDPYVSPEDLIMSPSELHAVPSRQENVVLISSGYSRTSGSH